MPGVIVDRRALVDDCVDVGHGDQEARLSPAQVLGDRELIEVAGVVVVDRAPEQLAEIADLALWRGRPLDPVELLLDGGGEFGLQTTVDHGLLGDVGEKRVMRAGMLCFVHGTV